MNNDDILRSVADNKLLLNAIKSVVMGQFEDHRTDASAFSDERLGQMYRALVVGRERVEIAFKEIEKYRTIPEGQPKVNRGR